MSPELYFYYYNNPDFSMSDKIKLKINLIS